jgi:hypothetical protein
VIVQVTRSPLAIENVREVPGFAEPLPESQ